MVITPQVLWKDFDRKLLPLNEAVVSCVYSFLAAEQLIYYNGETSAPGCTRVFARLATPLAHIDESQKEVAQDKPIAANAHKKALVLMCEPQTEITQSEIDGLLKLGYTVLVIDYAGNFSNRSRFTIYPKALSFCDYKDETTLIQSTQNPSKTCWYVWTVSALRGIALLEKLGYTHIAMLGIGTGGAQVWKVASFNGAIKAGITLYGLLPKTIVPSDSTGNETLTYMASLAAASYAPLLKSPLLEIVTSNERSSSLERMNDVFNAITREDCRLSVEPRANRSLSDSQHQNIVQWLHVHLDEGGDIPPKPQLTATVSDHALYYEITVTQPVQADGVFLYVAQGSADSAYRNWRLIRAERVGETEWLVKVDVYLPKEPFYAFASVLYQNNFTLSSEILTKTPALLGVTATPFVKKRLIYDSDMGEDDWLILDKSRLRKQIKLKQGPFGIQGVLLSNGTLSTFKLSDVVYRGNSDNVLQLILYTFMPQEVRFIVTDASSSEPKHFECVRSISPFDDWTKLTLSAEDFKSDNGILKSWDNVVIFELKADSEVLINSLLWV